jgi:putative membrane protein
MTESEFFKAASQINLLEIALADVATQKSQNAEVKKYAEMMRKDHTAANQKLQAVATKQGTTLETTLDTKHKQIQTEIEQKSGTEFDQAYATGMIKGHAKAIGKYQQATRLTNADVKKYATDTLPTLRNHLQQAKDLAKNVGVDETTISSASKPMPEGIGGPSDTPESETGAGKKDVPKKDDQPRKDSEPDK